MPRALIGRKVPPLSVSAWVQGEACNFGDLAGQVVLTVVFQVNCPGCFLFSLPQAIELDRLYCEQGLAVLGLATAFEDFDKNNLENLTQLLKTGVVVGETLKALNLRQQLQDGLWPHRIVFPVAMDKLAERRQADAESDIEAFIRFRLPDFQDRTTLEQKRIRGQLQNYFRSQQYRAETFERFNLQGTPSYILVDRQGILRACRFGDYPELQADIERLLQES